jgi:hypothetical protein
VEELERDNEVLREEVAKWRERCTELEDSARVNKVVENTFRNEVRDKLKISLPQYIDDMCEGLFN